MMKREGSASSKGGDSKLDNMRERVAKDMNASELKKT